MLTPEDQAQITLRMLAAPGSVWSLTGEQLRQLQGAYVYQHARETEEPGRSLYVGVKSAQGERPFSPDHHALGLRCDVLPTDTLHIYPMPTPGIAQGFEKIVLATFPGERNQQRYHANAWTRFSPIEPLQLDDTWNNERAGLESAL